MSLSPSPSIISYALLSMGMVVIQGDISISHLGEEMERLESLDKEAEKDTMDGFNEWLGGDPDHGG